MSDNSEHEAGDLSAAELQRRLDRLRKSTVVLSAEEVETVRAIIREWNFQEMRKDERKLEAEARRARLPLLGIVVSVSTSVLLWLATFIASHWTDWTAPKSSIASPSGVEQPLRKETKP